LRANIVRLYRGEEYEIDAGSGDLMDEYEIGDKYINIPGLCKVATIDEIKEQGWSLNPGRYVGIAEGIDDDFDFKERLQELNEELEILNTEASTLEDEISKNIIDLLE
jgi:type I restriction enzyme M protein